MIKAIWNYIEIPAILIGAHVIAGLAEHLLTITGA